MMYNDGIHNDFEHAHQKGLTRGFDLGWSYKGKYDRQLIRDFANKYPHGSTYRKVALRLVEELKKHKDNHEFITNS
jgi:hypothetical protein